MNEGDHLCRKINTSCFDRVPDYFNLNGETFRPCSSTIPETRSIYIETFYDQENSIAQPDNFLMINKERIAFHRNQNFQKVIFSSL